MRVIPSLVRSTRRTHIAVALLVLATCPAALAQALLALGHLPACAHLPLPPAAEAPAPEQPYMAAMRALGVRRAVVDVRGVWRHGALVRPTVYRRLYFRCYDCPFAQISDLEPLAEIERSALPAHLDQAALDRARSAHPPVVIDHPPRIEGRVVSLRALFFDSPRAPGSAWLAVPNANAVWPVSATHSSMQRGLAAIEADDTVALACILQMHAFTGAQLASLLIASLNFGPFNRAADIELLGAAGANPNEIAATGPWRGDLPLMRAIGNPTHVAALLDIGANPNATIQYYGGAAQSALDLARWQARHDPGPTSQCVLALLSTSIRPAGPHHAH